MWNVILCDAATGAVRWSWTTNETYAQQVTDNLRLADITVRVERSADEAALLADAARPAGQSDIQAERRPAARRPVREVAVAA